jgi:hypothetical protein
MNHFFTIVVGACGEYVGVLETPAANATLFDITGTFSDGGSISGTLNIPGPGCALGVNVANLTTTAGSELGGETYSGTEIASSCDATGIDILAYQTGADILVLLFDPHITPFSDSVSLNTSAEVGSAAARFLIGTASIAIPEPGTFALLGAGLAGIGFAQRRRRN